MNMLTTTYMAYAVNVKHWLTKSFFDLFLTPALETIITDLL